MPLLFAALSEATIVGKQNTNAVASVEVALANPAANWRAVAEALAAALSNKPELDPQPVRKTKDDSLPPSWWRDHARILRPKEVQRALGCGHTKYYELIAAGELLKPLRYGGITGHPQAEIDAFIEKLIAQRNDERPLTELDAVPADQKISRKPTRALRIRRTRDNVEAGIAARHRE